MSQWGSAIKPIAEKVLGSQGEVEQMMNVGKNQLHAEIAPLERIQHPKPEPHTSTTESSVTYTDKGKNPSGKSSDDNSDYFSKLGEVGTSNLVSFLATQLQLEDIEEMMKMFNVLDQDGNGVITANELRTIMSSLGQSTTEAEVMDMVNSIDSDGNGVIEFPEFLAMVSGKVPTTLNRSQLERIFKVFDVDNSGEINAENLKRMFKIFGQTFDDKTIASMLGEADFDGDGKVRLEDFVKLMHI